MTHPFDNLRTAEDGLLRTEGSSCRPSLEDGLAEFRADPAALLDVERLQAERTVLVQGIRDGALGVVGGARAGTQRYRPPLAEELGR